jgi:phospholipid/cholesterol/gamma-HCH transport system ATP-binding protein
VEAEPAIELVEVTKKLDAQQVLDGIDLAVPTGAITVLLGPSGAGKTVTIKHILGLLKPTKGHVRVEGKDLAEITEAELYEVRRGMAVLLQGSLPFSCGLFDSLNVHQNVSYALQERTNWSKEQIDAVTMDHLRLVGLQDHAERMPNELSAGMKKRTALARALALNARIMILDDLDAGLDAVRLTLLCDLIRELHEDAETTLLVTTHNMEAARRLADYVAVIHQGRIVASGRADDVFASGEPFVRQLVRGETEGPLKLSTT